VAALEEEGFHPEVSEEGKQLEGYHGDKRKELAHVIIPRKQVGGSSNDIGFAKDASGKYQAIISEFDRGRHGDKWLNKVKQRYATKMALKLARAKGLKLVREVRANNKITMVFNT